LEDDLKRKLFFIQSDHEMVSELQAKYYQAETFL
jgi:hypothetical protein